MDSFRRRFVATGRRGSTPRAGRSGSVDPEPIVPLQAENARLLNDAGSCCWRRPRWGSDAVPRPQPGETRARRRCADAGSAPNSAASVQDCHAQPCARARGRAKRVQEHDRWGQAGRCRCNLSGHPLADISNTQRFGRPRERGSAPGRPRPSCGRDRGAVRPVCLYPTCARRLLEPLPHLRHLRLQRRVRLRPQLHKPPVVLRRLRDFPAASYSSPSRRWICARARASSIGNGSGLVMNFS